MSARGLEQLAEAMRQEWRERAACVGAYRQGDEFVDVVDPERARDLIRRYCFACVVVGQCREVADAGAPYRLHDYVAGARHYQRHEPREG
ncbi:MAG: hypothetical protein U0R76_07465 [Candidatus Nanopelagicales bacterium]